MEPIFSTKGNGKLLLTGEYFVLDGAQALAIPSNYGQRLAIFPDQGGCLTWESYAVDDTMWFSARFSLPDLQLLSFSDEKTGLTLQKMLLVAKANNPFFLSEKNGLLAKIKLEFPTNWGLGSSSTLLYTLAKWAEVDPFLLSDATLGGSGYDIACASTITPIFYSKSNNQPKVEATSYKPLFSNQLYFIHLGKKQNSRLGIQRYREKVTSKDLLIKEISRLSHQFHSATTLSDLEKVIKEHEDIIAAALELPRAKDLYFNDYWGEIKSLGAWGGDFVLVTNDRGEEEMKGYFMRKGLETILSYEEMVL